MTSSPPTNQQLDDIEAREKAATKGPWGFYDGSNYADVAADMEVTSRGSYSYREKIARLEDEDYWDDPAHEDDAEECAPEQMAANAAFIAHAREDVPALVAEVRRLRALNADLDRALGETIDDRDQAQEIADKLAYAVAPNEVIGEHSSMNCPWTNALDLITPAADVDKLRRERDLAIAHDRQPYPTAWAYEQACKAREKHRERAEALAATLREVLHTFAPMRDSVDGPVSYYDGSADIEPVRFERWRAVLDGQTPPSTSVCHVCNGVAGFIDCPTGGWWAHEQHPADGHDAQPTRGEHCSAALMPLNADPVEPCVVHGPHERHRAESGESWTDADSGLE
jgi:hypothetical protein